MLKSNRNRPVVISLVMSAVMLVTFSSPRAALATAPQPGDGQNNVLVSGESAGNPAVLDAHRRLALGMIETGNRDDEIGGAGEVSRYQIMPSVWRQYSRSVNYRNPDVSLTVAQQHWGRLYAAFIRKAHRQPTDFDMYVLWNTHYGYYASRGFNPNRLAAVVRDRAQRYVNLVQCSDL